MDPRRAQLEQLVQACGRRAYAVAYALLRDHHEAADAVQQAYLVAARKPERIPSDDAWPWFSVVVAYEARNLRRKKRPATNHPSGERDMPAAHPSQLDPGTATVLDEERAHVRAALDALPSPERDAVALTQMVGMTHAAAARALDVPRQTLTSAVQRGLDRMGHTLRREPVGVTGALAVLPAAMPPGGWEAATDVWLKSAVSALAPAGTAAGSALGGAALMSSKTLLVLTLTVAVGAGFLGGTLWPTTTNTGEPAIGGSDARLAQMSADAPSSGSPTLGAPPSPGEVDALRREVADLRARLDRATTHGEALEKRLAAASSAAKGPTFTFGSMGRLDAVREADWREMAQASVVVEEGVRGILAFKEKGEQPPRELYLRLQENVEKMRKYEYRTVGKMPTAAKHNGEITHPITMANLLAAILAEAGMPLDGDQVERINRLGLEFESEFRRVRERYTDATPRIERMLEEYRLKGRFTDDVIAVLTPAQRTKAVHAETKGIAGLDLNSPTLMILHTSPVIVGTSIEEISGKMRALLTKKLDLGESDGAALEGALDAWSHDVRDLLVPVPQLRLKHYTYAEGDRAGAATLALTNRLLKDLPLSETARAALLDDYAIYVPRILKM